MLHENISLLPLLSRRMDRLA